MSVKRIVVPVVLALVLVGALGASSAVSAPTKVSTPTRVTTKSLTINVRLIQEATFHLKDHFLQTTLHLFAVGETLGFPSNTFLGSMLFTYQFLPGSACSASTAGCTGSTALETVTTFPGGTITAGGPKIKLTTGLIVPITKGTGVFKGVTGSIVIAPGDNAESIYRLTLPS
jgi:hypothetical protein